MQSDNQRDESLADRLDRYIKEEASKEGGGRGIIKTILGWFATDEAVTQHNPVERVESAVDKVLYHEESSAVVHVPEMNTHVIILRVDDDES